MTDVDATERRARSGGRAVLSLVALVALTAIAAAAFGRLFSTGTWWPAALGAALIGHGGSWLGRQLRLRAAPALTAAGIALVLYALWISLGRTTAAGVPTPRTLSFAVEALGDAVTAVRDGALPGPVLPGVQLVGLLAIGCAAILADALAFRAARTMWAAVPSLLVVCMAVALAPPGTVYGWTVAFVGAAGVFCLVDRFELRATAPVQFVGAHTTPRPITPIGVAFTAICVVGAVSIAPLLPRLDRADAAPRDQRISQSPLLSVQPLAAQATQAEQFTVESAEGHHWRLVALDTYDGDVWKVETPYEVGDGALASEWSTDAGSAVRQTFTISQLSSLWLPAAYRAVELDGDGKVGWDRISESLISPATGSAGLRYRVDSVAPTFTPNQLRTADNRAVPKEVLDRYTALPSLPEDIWTLSRDVTLGAPTMFDRVVAVQTFLHDGFTVDAVAPGHSTAALHQFLIVAKKGTVEQFAAALATLARAADLPARVVVGFDAGERGPDGLWHVRGADAAAWVEVLLGEFGWVPFAATPSEGPLGAMSPGSGDAQTGDEPNEGVDAMPLDSGARPVEPPPSAEPPPEVEQPSRWLQIAFLVAVTIAVLWLVGVPSWRAVRRRRRRRSARTGSDAVLVAFTETAERLADAGCPLAPSDTLVEHAHRAGRDGHLPASHTDDVHALARHAAAALYRAEPAGVDPADARTRAERIQREVLSSASPWRRAAWALDPRVPTPAGRRWRPRREPTPAPRERATSSSR